MTSGSGPGGCCCGGTQGCVGRTCESCNYLLILRFTDAVHATYDVQVNGVTVASFVDSIGCSERAYVIGDYSDCTTTVNDLKTELGDACVGFVSTLGLEGVSDCESTCAGITITLTSSSGTPTSVAYELYRTCHDVGNKSCCPACSDTVIVSDTPLEFQCVNICCCCCTEWYSCENYTVTISNLVTSLVTITGGVETITPKTFDHGSFPTVPFLSVTICPSPGPNYEAKCTTAIAASLSPAIPLDFLYWTTAADGKICPTRSIVFCPENFPDCDDSCISVTFGQHNDIRCVNGQFQIPVAPYDLHETARTSEADSFWYSRDNKSASFIPATSAVCAPGSSSLTFLGIANDNMYHASDPLIQPLNPCGATCDPPDWVITRYSYDLTVTCLPMPMAVNPSSPQPQLQAQATTPPVRAKCAYLGERTEYKKGCGGSRCKHECDHPNPVKQSLHMIAVPMGNCQTCPDWRQFPDPEDIV